jgi:thiol-disulfide isomerase/thioredoxin
VPIGAGSRAPDIHGVSFDEAPVLVAFYKVTCPVCQMAAPVVDAIAAAVPGGVVGVGQDPAAKLAAFAADHGMARVPAVEDPPPYPASDAYGIVSVPTLFLVNDGVVDDVVEAWDRDGFNRVAARLAGLSGVGPVAVSDASDGRPPFKPG